MAWFGLPDKVRSKMQTAAKATWTGLQTAATRPRVTGWTDAERARLPAVLRHIRTNSADVKWQTTGRPYNVSFPKFVAGIPAKKDHSEHYLPASDRWTTANMSKISYCAALRLNGHTCVALLINKTWYTLGLFAAPGKKTKELDPLHVPLINPKIMKTLRAILPSVSAFLKQTTLVQFAMPDKMVSDHWVHTYERYKDKCPNEFKGVVEGGRGARDYYDLFNYELEEGDSESDMEVLWVGLCPLTTKAALEKMMADKTFKPAKLVKGYDFDDAGGALQFFNDARLRGFSADFNNAGTMGVDSSYSTGLNNCVSLVESLTGLPCKGLGMHAPGFCDFDRETMVPDIGFLKEDIDAALQHARAKRGPTARLADWMISCQANQILAPGNTVRPDLAAQPRRLVAIGRYMKNPSYLILWIGFGRAAVNSGACAVAWCPLYFATSKKGGNVFTRATNLQAVTGTVQNSVLYAVVEATAWNAELMAIIENAAIDGIPIETNRRGLERLGVIDYAMRHHNDACKALDRLGLWDALSPSAGGPDVNYATRRKHAAHIINEFNVP